MGTVKLEQGKVYTHRSGGDYQCICSSGDLAKLQRVSDNWTFTAHGTRMEPTGAIHWDYGSGGRWEDK